MHERLRFASAGIGEAWRRESSFRAHVGMAAAALVLLLVTRPAPAWWAAFGIAAGLVMACELFNSALEALVDLLHPGLHPEIKVVKDMASGAVMLAGAAALVVMIAFVVASLPGWWASLR